MTFPELKMETLPLPHTPIRWIQFSVGVLIAGTGLVVSLEQLVHQLNPFLGV